jgi:hypothetical protein
MKQTRKPIAAAGAVAARSDQTSVANPKLRISGRINGLKGYPCLIVITKGAAAASANRQPVNHTSALDCNLSRLNGIAFRQPAPAGVSGISSLIAARSPVVIYNQTLSIANNQLNRGSSFALSKN